MNHLETEVKTHAKMAAVHAVAMGNAMSEGGEKILEWGKEALKSYNEVAGGTRELKNILGGTAEDMSRLRFAGAELGVSTSSISHAMLMAATHMERGDKIAKQFGVSLKDASGKTKPSIQLFGEMADRLMSIQDPLKRNAAGLEMFGRGYRDMIPLLKRGSEGIKELGDESDRLGLTMSQKDLDSTKQFGLAVKQLKANLEGVMVTVGRHLIPILGGLVKIFSEAVS